MHLQEKEISMSREISHSVASKIDRVVLKLWKYVLLFGALVVSYKVSTSIEDSGLSTYVTLFFSVVISGYILSVFGYIDLYTEWYRASRRVKWLTYINGRWVFAQTAYKMLLCVALLFGGWLYFGAKFLSYMAENAEED
jgi:hypothetical protein